MEEPKSDVARRVFDFWKSATKHPRSYLDAKRMKLICARLSDGYEEGDLKMAAFGCAHSRFHQGENDRHQVYDSVELIYRNADMVDKFIRLGEQEMRKRQREKEQQKMMDDAALRASTTGPTYRKERSRLLSIVKKAGTKPGADYEEDAA